MINITTPILNYQLVTITATQSQTRYYFPDLPNLRAVKTYKIISYHSGLISRDLNGVVVVGQGDFEASYLTINSNGFENIQKLGLSALQTIAKENNTVNQNGTLGLQPMEIDFSKSYVEIAPTIVTSYPFSFVFGIYYAK